MSQPIEEMETAFHMKNPIPIDGFLPHQIILLITSRTIVSVSCSLDKGITCFFGQLQCLLGKFISGIYLPSTV